MVASMHSTLTSALFVILAATTCISQVSDDNVALHKRAQQSGTYGGRDASRAVDGYLYSESDSRHCSSVDTSDQRYQGDRSFAWWQVDLADTYTIENLTVYNTNDNEEWRYLFDFAVYVSYDSDVTDSVPRSLCRRIDSKFLPVPVLRNESLWMNCTTPRVGRYVTIQRKGGNSPNRLTLCEVEIEASRYYQCTNCQVSCSNSLGCSRCNPGYYPPACTSGCASGTFGTNCAERCPVCDSGLPCNSISGECPACVDPRYCQNDNSAGVNSSSTVPAPTDKRPSGNSTSGEKRTSATLPSVLGSLVLVTALKAIEFQRC